MDHHENSQSSCADEIEKQANRLFSRDCNFITSVAQEENLPDTDFLEFAFAGRSNVGKSSLINALVNRKNLVKTSKTPGRTQQINFFDLDSRLYLIDLPGYGFAKASKKIIHVWNKLIEAYLKGRVQLKRVYVLIDSRHGLKPLDLKTLDLLDEAAVSYQIVLTKIDKISVPQQTRCMKDVKSQIEKRPAAFPEVLMTSSEKRLGLNELRCSIYSLL